jgi:hypothetical protein
VSDCVHLASDRVTDVQSDAHVTAEDVADEDSAPVHIAAVDIACDEVHVAKLSAVYGSSEHVDAVDFTVQHVGESGIAAAQCATRDLSLEEVHAGERRARLKLAQEDTEHARMLGAEYAATNRPLAQRPPFPEQMVTQRLKLVARVLGKLPDECG